MMQQRGLGFGIVRSDPKCDVRTGTGKVASPRNFRSACPCLLSRTARCVIAAAI